MVIVATTRDGSLTLPDEIKKHLGLKPEDEVAFDVLSNGQVVLAPAPPKASIRRIFGMLHDPSQPVMTVEEMNNIIADGWAGNIP